MNQVKSSQLDQVLPSLMHKYQDIIVNNSNSTEHCYIPKIQRPTTWQKEITFIIFAVFATITFCNF